MRCCIKLSFALAALACTGSGHRGGSGKIAFIEASGSLMLDEDESSEMPELPAAGSGESLAALEARRNHSVTNHTPALTHHARSPAKQHVAGQPMASRPPRGPTTAKGAPPKKLPRDLLTTSSFIECVQGALSILTSGRRENSHRTEQMSLSLKIILCSAIIIGLLLCLCCCCVAEGVAEDFRDERSEYYYADQISLFSQASTRRNAPSDRKGRNFKNRIKKWAQSLANDVNPTIDEGAEGDRETPEDRMALLMADGPPKKGVVKHGQWKVVE